MDLFSIPNGSVTSPAGFRAGATFAGLKTRGEGKLDLTILLSETPCAGAGVFTQNRIAAAPVHLCREHLRRARPRAVVVNSGSANACIGDQGMTDAREMARLVADKLGLQPEEVLVCSTGIIGVELPMGIIRAGIQAVRLTEDGGHGFAQAIVTTDTHPKEVGVSLNLAGRTVRVAGAAKGAGMIHPNMATLLGFVTTDAAVEADFLQTVLKEAVETSFNMVTVDGDTSTNDTVLLLANGAAGNPPIGGGPDGEALQAAVTEVCVQLAKMIAADGEGATKLLEVRVEGAASLADARKAARTIAGSNLLKAAVYGNDPNWGRAIAALGRSGARVVEKRVSLYINDICVLDGGKPIPFFKGAAIATMQQATVRFLVRLNAGPHAATAWGCDLTERYVAINSAYTT
ncbi:MAG: bifunctional glutamate N-acetyltransferase/amino-acid acetyltransferase ArgJ [Chloroflexi bacterium]|nr:bifunctional glutamate N-acetyltransferase/amino-acid acetyltransferase ArgJ [Chloroflexota bacterium]